ncbi:transposase [Rodentibacter myodis]|uniref:transposase n=1 Tax=Rodentibacter myodis TaxID=1907939 RepID=UPI0026814797
MDLMNHQLINSIERVKCGLQRILDSVQENSLTLFDKGFYFLDLLYQWQTSSTQSHWLIPLRKGVKCDVLRELGLEKTEKGKHFQYITSLLNNTTYPANEVVSVYRHRQEIELGYREVKQYLLDKLMH